MVKEFRPVDDMATVDEIVKEFLVESSENLDRLDRNLVELEKSTCDQTLLADVFRTIHSIKGTTGFLGFHRLEAVAHAGENLLARLRDGLLSLTPDITTGLLAMVDAIRAMLKLIEETQSDGDKDYAELIAAIAELQRPAAQTATIPAVSAPVAVNPAPAAPKVEETAKAAEDPAGKNIQATAPEAMVPVSETRDLPIPLFGKLLLDRGIVSSKDLSDVLEQQRRGDTRKVGEILIANGAAKPADVAEALASQQSLSEQYASDRTVRVAVSLLERLMDLAGELVLTRNQIIQFAAGQRDSAFLAASQRLNLVTSDMREIIMKTRLQPVQNVMGKFPRMVRDLALNCGKQVRIELFGQDTELDRGILEAIKDPLSHAVRNSIDHGIESPEARTAAGKSPEGCLTLRAFHEGGQVNIEVSDDGAGIDPGRIRKKAIEKGLITTQQGEKMKAHEIVNLIFQPGFSTAERVTNVSGRGVGMDVVKTNIERIGGTVDIQSAPGAGSTLRMKIPLTLAIIPALIVRSGEIRFAIPQINLLELLRLRDEKAASGIEMAHGSPVYRLRGNLLPLLFLRRELGQLSDQVPHDRHGHPLVADQLNIVVLQAEGQQFGLVVDGIHDAEEIVVKPLGQHLKHIPAFSGATVMGDGDIALILDVSRLVQGSRLFTGTRKAPMTDSPEKIDSGSIPLIGQKQELLLFRASGNRRTAVPLSNIDRLEEFKPGQFERAGGKTVVQYRDGLLPIVSLSDEFNNAQSGGDATLKVLVCNHNGRRVGVVVDQILDVAEQAVCVDQRWKDSQSAGSAVVQKQITDFLDLNGIFPQQEITEELAQ